MTTITELIKFLETLPLDTELSVNVSESSGYVTKTWQEPLDIDQIAGNVDFVDMTNNKFAKKGDNLWNKKFLSFGEDR